MALSALLTCLFSISRGSDSSTSPGNLLQCPTTLFSSIAGKHCPEEPLRVVPVTGISLKVGLGDPSEKPGLEMENA